MNPTFYWHDYETFGLSPSLDRPSQFAGIRTDMDLNELGAPLMLYCQPTPDYLPDPESCLITGITPQQCLEKGLPEPQFSSAIYRELASPETIALGYNTLRFDDEVTRFMLWRNLFKPYTREFENGCSRWDLLDVIRCAYALRPEGIVWPKLVELDKETGHEIERVSLRLEHLTAANALAHSQAHDALCDVRATIAMARLLKTAQPKLFDFCLNLRGKVAVQKQIGWPYTREAQPKPFLHISGMFGAEKRFLSVVWPLAQHPTNKNELIVWDLREDPCQLNGLSIEEIRQRLFTSNAKLTEQGLQRLPIKTIHINKAPIVISQLKTLSADQAHAAGIDWTIIEANEAIAAQHHLHYSAMDWASVFVRDFGEETRCAEAALYGGGFVSDADYRELSKALDAERAPTGYEPKLSDARMQALWWRYRARHYPHTLNEQEIEDWQNWRAQELLEGDPSEQGGIDAWFERLNTVAQQHQNEPDALSILERLHEYAQQLSEQLNF